MHRMHAALLGLALCACDARTDPVPTPLPPDTSVPAAAPTTRAPLDSTTLIRADGMAIARRGMTIGDLRAALPPGTQLGELTPFMVDIDAMPIVHDTDTLYYVLIPTGEPSSDDAAVNILATDNAAFRTAEGVGPGTTLAVAAAAYGAPTLSYNINDESREYATFPRLPPTIRLRVMPASDASSHAGVYDTQGEYNETAQYDPAARVMMVMVWMR